MSDDDWSVAVFKCAPENFRSVLLELYGFVVDRIELHGVDAPNGAKLPGSINQLEAFAKKNIRNLTLSVSQISGISIYLEAKKMPIHEDDPKIVQVLLKWEYKMPPNWSSLWTKALTKYRDSLEMLKKAIK